MLFLLSSNHNRDTSLTLLLLLLLITVGYVNICERFCHRSFKIKKNEGDCDLLVRDPFYFFQKNGYFSFLNP